jgi:hypothetical protein
MYGFAKEIWRDNMGEEARLRFWKRWQLCLWRVCFNKHYQVLKTMLPSKPVRHRKLHYLHTVKNDNMGQ